MSARPERGTERSTATFWVEREQLNRLVCARAAVVLVGGYDGCTNYGDVLQLEAALEVVRGLGPTVLPLATVELGHLGRHRDLRARFPQLFGDASFVYFSDRPAHEVDHPTDGLVPLAGGHAFVWSCLYLYGGGYLNELWGERKAMIARAAEDALLRMDPTLDPPVLLVASGLQIAPAALEAEPELSDLLGRAAIVGVRDAPSLDAVRERLPEADCRLSADDATLVLTPETAIEEERDDDRLVVNVHLSEADYATDDPGALLAWLSRLLEALDERSGPAGVEIAFVVAYEDRRVSERAAVERFVADHRRRLDARLRDRLHVRTVDILEDRLDRSLAWFRRASLTIACSYHVALTSLMAGIPTIHIAANDYYRQKASGLRSLFDLPEPWFVDVQDTDPAEAAELAIALAAPSSKRERAIERVRGGARIAAMHRQAAEIALARTLAASYADALTERAPPRADQPDETGPLPADLRAQRQKLIDATGRLEASARAARERERAARSDALAAQDRLEAITATRAWKLVTRYWRAREVVNAAVERLSAKKVRR